MVGQPRECMGRGWKNVGHSSGFSPASPQNEFLESPHLIPATKPASARGLWPGATLYFSALGVGSVSLLLPCIGLSWFVTFWPFCNDSERAQNAHSDFVCNFISKEVIQSHLSKMQAPSRRNLTPIRMLTLNPPECKSGVFRMVGCQLGPHQRAHSAHDLGDRCYWLNPDIPPWPVWG